MPETDLHPAGAWSLSRSVAVAARSAFVDPLRDGADGGPAVLDLVLALDGSWEPVALRVVQDGDGSRADVLANPGSAPEPTIRREVERVLRLDLDGTAFSRIGEEDPVVADLQRVIGRPATPLRQVVEAALAS